MGNLNSDMSGSEITALLNVLSKHGVTMDDAHLMRTNEWSDFCGSRVARAWAEAHQLINDVLSGDDEEKALVTLKEFDAPSMLKEIYVATPFSSVRVAIMEKLTSAHTLWELIARAAHYPASQDKVARIVGMKRLLQREGYGYLKILYQDSMSWMDLETYHLLCRLADEVKCSES